MRNCRICEGLELGPRPIFQLDQGAKILIVGQAPGRITHLKDRPFDDPSGERLRAWLGVTRETFYEDRRIGIFPMGLCFPGTGKSGDNPPRAICAETWRSKVMAALDQLALTIVLGRYAIEWHLPEMKNRSVGDAVKCSAKGQNGVFVLPHPSPRNNRWLKQNEWFERDVIPRMRHRVAELLVEPDVNSQ
ncbi:MAG: uracil-DNA glycosylase family protein [Paracoccaceae bacterium]|nr:uracil-DNA glycosylase family protein [Paracoccaceae bacterium]